MDNVRPVYFSVVYPKQMGLKVYSLGAKTHKGARIPHFALTCKLFFSQTLFSPCRRLC